MNRTADIVICGAGITGVAAAYSLSKAGYNPARVASRHRRDFSSFVF